MLELKAEPQNVDVYPELDAPLKLISVVNYQHMSVQAGIQTAHLVHKLFTKYATQKSHEYYAGACRTLDQWAQHDHTIVVKRGGGCASLQHDYQELSKLAMKLELPHTRWFESQEALNGALTCIGVVIPVYNTILPEVAVNKDYLRLRTLVDKYALAV